MRLWSLHPKYLDAKGLVALWREALLAKAVLEGKTKGYIHHPQLTRFLSLKNPVAAIHSYLQAVYEEALSRGYRFERSKFSVGKQSILIMVTTGQLEYEFQHLQKKLSIRDPERFHKIEKKSRPSPHPLFEVEPGGIADWEKIRQG